MRAPMLTVSCPVALPPDELRELRSSQHRASSTLAAVIDCSQARHRRDWTATDELMVPRLGDDGPC